MSFPQLGYQYIRPIYPQDRQGIGSARAGTDLSPSGALSNVLSTMYGSPFAAAQSYGAFLPYSNDLSIFNQLVSNHFNFCAVFSLSLSNSDVVHYLKMLSVLQNNLGYFSLCFKTIYY